MKKQAGFTLIELVTVIIILGILAAFAVPRFIDLTTEARAASINGLGGSVKAAAALAHSVAVAQKGQAAYNGPITMDGVQVTLVNGFPAATTTTGIGKALQSYSGFSATVTGSTVEFTTAPPPGTTADCHVDYSEAPSAATTASTVIVTTDCG